MGSQAERAELRNLGDIQLIAEVAEGEGDCALVPGLLAYLGGSRSTLKETLSYGEDERIRLEGWEDGDELVRTHLRATTGGKTAPFPSSWKISGDNLPVFILTCVLDKKENSKRQIIV